MSLEALWAEIDQGGMWPILRDKQTQYKLEDRRALAYTITENEQLGTTQRTLQELAGWTDLSRRYHADPLAQTITRAFADGLFGSSPTITADNTSDQERLDQIRRVSELDSELHRAARISTGEGEAWWHVYRDSTVATPVIAFESRRFVLPWLSGRRVVACLFASAYQLSAQPYDGGDKQGLGAALGGPNYRVLRVFEGHEVGRVETRAYVGTWTTIGERVELNDIPATQGLADEWNHGLGIILAGRVINEASPDNHYLGVSEFDSVQQMLLDLDESRAIGAENARLTAKKRAIVRGELTRSAGTDPNGVITWDAGADIMQVTDEGLGDAASGSPLTILEYKYDSAALIAHMESLEAAILARRGIAAVYSSIPQHSTRAEPGVAIRLKLVPTDQATATKGREWDEQLIRAFGAAILVDSDPYACSAAGVPPYPWSSTADPTVVRGDGIPLDTADTATNAALKFTSGIQSLEQSIEEIHPEWDDDQVAEEAKKINDEQAAKAPQLPPMFDHQHDPLGLPQHDPATEATSKAPPTQ